MPGSENTPDAQRQPVFVTTHWSVVLAAQDKSSPYSAAALETLCRAYWYPLYAYVRRSGRSPHDAQDLTQDFFAHLLEHQALGGVSPEKGRFRSFLLASLKNLLTNDWKKANRQKRGGGAATFSLDEAMAEERYQLEPADPLSPEIIYERRWVETVLERVLTRLRSECDGSGRTERFEVLKVFLLDEKGTMPLADAAQRLGLSLVAVKGVIHRMRQRYREIFRDEVAHTVATEGEVEEEIRCLLRALGGG